MGRSTVYSPPWVCVTLYYYGSRKYGTDYHSTSFNIYPATDYLENTKFIHSYVEDIIDKAFTMQQGAQIDHTPSVLETLIHDGHSRLAIRSEVLSRILGSQQIITTLCWLLYELATHPDFVKRLRTEIASTLGFENPPTLDGLKNCLPLLKNTVQEILRLYPPQWMILREAAKDTVLPTGGGYDGSLPIGVPKGTKVLCATMVLHRRNDLSQNTSGEDGRFHKFDANEFAPDRWTHWRPQPWHYLPFNGGPRSCVGQQFSFVMVSYIICRILQQFEFLEPRDLSKRPKLKLAATLLMEDFLDIRFKSQLPPQ